MSNPSTGTYSTIPPSTYNGEWRRNAVGLLGNLKRHQTKFNLPGDPEAFQKAVSLGKNWTPENLFDMVIQKAAFTPMRTVRMAQAVSAGKVFNDGAKKRPFAITSDDALVLKNGSLMGMNASDAIMTWLSFGRYEEVEVGVGAFQQVGTPPPVKDDLDAVHESVRSRFRVGGASPAYTLNRIRKHAAGRAHFGAKIVPPTPDEVTRAGDRCGIVIGSKRFRAGLDEGLFMACESPWPLMTEDEGRASAKINLSSSLGFPAHTSGRNVEALKSELQTARFLVTDPAWRNDPTGMYKRAKITTPSLVLCTAKAKQDMYTREKIQDGMLRLYVVIPGGYKFAMAPATQPFEAARMTLPLVAQLLWDRSHVGLPGRDVRRMGFVRTAQKMGLTGDGPALIVQCLDAQLNERGYGFVHCGDDTLMVAIVHQEVDEEHDYVLHICGLDCTSFDLTQQLAVCDPIYLDFHSRMSQIDPHRASLWLNMARSRLLLLNGAAVVDVEGLGTSGNQLQSLVNDVLMEVLCARIEKKLEKKAATLPVINITWPEIVEEPAHATGEEHDDGDQYCRALTGVGLQFLKDAVAEEGRKLGLQVRVDTVQSKEMRGGFLWGRGEMINRALQGGDVEIAFLGTHIAYYDVPDMVYTMNIAPYEGQEDPEILSINRGTPHWDEENPGRTTLGRMLSVVPDLTRLVPGLRYPGGKYEADKRVFDLRDVCRIHSVISGAGCLTALPDFQPVKKFICAMLQKKLDEYEEDESLPEDEEVSVFLKEEGTLLTSVGDLRKQIVGLFEDPLFVCREGGPFDPARPSRVKTLPPCAAAEAEDLDLEVAENTRWADLDEDEADEIALALDQGRVAEGTDLMQLAEGASSTMPVPTLAALAYRTVQRSNFGRPPPNVAVRNDPTPRALQVREAAPAASGMTKSQRSNARKKRATARKRGAQLYDEEETHRNLDEQRALDLADNEGY